MAGLFDFLTGGGGGGGGSGSVDAMREYLQYMRDQQGKQELLTAREKDTSETMSAMRRGELQDRSGYAGTVGVGDAVQESDATLAARMGTLDAADPTRIAYESSVAKEQQQGTVNWHIVTGEKYTLDDNVTTAQTAAAASTDSAGIQAQIDKVKAMTDANPWYDASAGMADLEAKLAAKKKEEADAEAQRLEDEKGAADAPISSA